MYNVYRWTTVSASGMLPLARQWVIALINQLIIYWLITAMDSTLPPLICSYPEKFIFSSRKIVCI